MSTVIKTSGLSRVYQTYRKPEGLWNSIKGFWQRQYEAKVALSPTDLEISDGQIVGLVGANGAGKTTLLKLLSGLIYPTSGKAEVLGLDPWSRSSVLLKQISILLGQKAQLWWDIPAADSFDLLARIYDINRTEARGRTVELARLLSCDDLLHVQLRRLSLGERMKMEIIGSLLHRPKVLFLDEPTIGLDIVAQNTIRDFLSEYARAFRPTIILTSHYMDDISRLANRLLLISQGQIVYDGTVRDFVAKAESKRKIFLKLASPLTQDIELGEGQTAKAGQDLIEANLSSSKIGGALASVMAQAPLLDMKLEETDFEDVIHRFLEKDIRYRPIGHSHTI